MDYLPSITVLMPVYNGEEYLPEAIESVLGQTWTDFEFLILNDGSTDKSFEIIKSYSDSRIRFVENEKNVGLISTLNKGINLSRGKYIARMDCDDISLPQRLEKQASFLDTHPEIGVCGSWIQIFSDDMSYIQKYALTSEEIRCTMLFYCGLAHPTVIIRKNIILKYQLYYDCEYIHAEDYELWQRLFNHTVFANIPEVLLHYRISKNQISNINRKQQSISALRVRKQLLNSLNIYPNDEEIEIHESLAFKNYQDDNIYIEKVNEWLNKIMESNRILKLYQEPYFSNLVKRYWFEVCNHAVATGNCDWSVLTSSVLYDKHLISAKEKYRFVKHQLLSKW